jgi:hypothetical protein
MIESGGPRFMSEWPSPRSCVPVPVAGASDWAETALDVAMSFLSIADTLAECLRN